jgi:hypothetical protein
MWIRNSCVTLALASAAVVPAFANEAGYIQPAPQVGSFKATIPAAAMRGAQPGDVSSDGRYVYLGTEAGWSVRPHEMAFQAGSLVHGESCMHAAVKPSLQRSELEDLLLEQIQIGS